MAALIHLVKLCVGADSVEDLSDWIARHGPSPEHVTRMWPQREAEVLAGGSLYWVVKGAIQCRQRILSLVERRGEDGILRCGLQLSPEVIRTAHAPRRAFQGWRYLRPEEAPPDLPKARAREEALPPKLAEALAEIGLR